MSSTTTMGVRGYARVCVGMRSVGGCAQVFVKVCGCLRVCAWDEFSEYLLENRVSTSADFNTYPIRIFKKRIYWMADLPSRQKSEFRF